MGKGLRSERQDPYMIGCDGSRGEINSKEIYNIFDSKSDLGGRVVTWETTWSGVWFLQLCIPCCVL